MRDQFDVTDTQPIVWPVAIVSMLVVALVVAFLNVPSLKKSLQDFGRFSSDGALDRKVVMLKVVSYSEDGLIKREMAMPSLEECVAEQNRIIELQGGRGAKLAIWPFCIEQK